MYMFVYYVSLSFKQGLISCKLYTYYVSFSFKQDRVVFEGGQRPDDLFFLRQYRQFGE